MSDVFSSRVYVCVCVCVNRSGRDDNQPPHPGPSTAKTLLSPCAA